MTHAVSHPLAGKTVTINSKAADPVQGAVVPGAEYRIEDYWDSERVFGKSWMFSDGNFAALHYAMRSAAANLPLDDEVVYGKIGAFGHIVHISELGDPV
jgi:hypothetical protein